MSYSVVIKSKREILNGEEPSELGKLVALLINSQDGELVSLEVDAGSVVLVFKHPEKSKK